MARPMSGDGDGDGDRRVWLGAVAGGWVRVDAATATLTVELVEASCEEVTPAAPELIAGGVCRGVVTGPTLTLADTEGSPTALIRPGLTARVSR